jgi:hypothetical protein
MQTDVSTSHTLPGEPRAYAERLTGQNPWWLLVKQIPFVLALCLAPLGILWHECGHYVVWYLQGYQPVLRAGSVAVGRWPPGSSGLPGRVGGPAMDLVACVTGFLWLSRRRRGRSHTPPTVLDWLATLMACACGRWILFSPEVLWRLFLTGRAGGGDEPTISTLLGLPAWFVPVAVFFPACCIFVVTVCQHPRSQRLLPFASLILGGAIGAKLWLWVIGPLLLGPHPLPAQAQKNHALRPKVVSIVPADGAINVDPNLADIRVTFDRPMSDTTWSFCGEGPHFPEPVGRPHYDRTRMVWTAPVKLKPGWTYNFWLNSEEYKGFVSDEGAPLAPVFVSFTTWDLNSLPHGYFEKPPLPSFPPPIYPTGTSALSSRGVVPTP